MFRSRKLFIPSFLLALALSVCPGSLEAQKPGENIYSQTGFTGSLNEGPPDIKYISIHVPRIGSAYQVKINFIKVETSAAAVDAYVEHLNKQAEARGETPSTTNWDEIRERLMKVISKADFEVLDSGGNSVGRATDLGLTTFFRTVKFTSKSSDYTVKLRCSSGAGAYHLTLEWL
jgi:hypothetical protein